ncbi:MAG: hypothetical protein NTZ46_07935 [Verrucomicrobia bacterium]|nr:hypothetical protein [Verrucomicrobiota bacterium]
MKHLAPLLFAAVALSPASPAHAGVVFETSFESPAVTGRTPKAAGADISKPSKPGEKPAWSCFEDQPDIGAEGGGVVAGLTNQVARTGTQALFIEASKLSVPYLGVLLVTQTIPIEGGRYYKINLWGRNDAQMPLVCAMAQLFLKMRVDFFSDEGITEIGESQYMLQPLPGGKGHAPLLVPTAWNPVEMRFGTPAAAKFMVVSFRCDSSAERGAISGTVYFDDFTVHDQQPPTETGAKAAPFTGKP